MLEELFGFQRARDQAEVIAFYGQEVYGRLLEFERRKAQERQVLWRRASELVDDVSSQIAAKE